VCGDTQGKAKLLADTETDLAAYAALFISAFTSATLLPGSSEAALLTLLAMGRGEPVTLVVVATAGNLLGSLVNWMLGRFFSALRERRWFPIDEPSYRRATDWFNRYGVWSLLLSWLPIIGDPLTVVAGALRVGLLRFVLLVSIGKGARYIFIVGAYSWWNGA
jgi:membrane protein YqaA with SNARE-associated domain